MTENLRNEQSVFKHLCRIWSLNAQDTIDNLILNLIRPRRVVGNALEMLSKTHVLLVTSIY